MKKLEAELRSLRLQMEEDFLLTNERFAEMQRSMGCVEESLEQLNDTVADLGANVDNLRENVDDLRGTVETLQGNVETLRESLEDLRNNVEDLRENVEGLKGNVVGLQANVEGLKGTVHHLQDGVSGLQRSFRDFTVGNRAYNESWHQERKRNLHVLDVLQAGLLTSGLETESRFDQIEARLRRLEEQHPGAA